MDQEQAAATEGGDESTAPADTIPPPPPEEDGRAPLDQYFTPPELARAIVQRTKERRLLRQGAHVCEPSVGKAAFAIAVHETEPGAIVSGVDLEVQPEARAEFGRAIRHMYQCDWLEPNEAAFDLIIGNPPFSAAEAHVRAALGRLAPNGAVVFLLRSSFLATAERVPLFEEFPPAFVDYVSPRPSFTGGGTDMAEYAVLTWCPDVMHLVGAPRVGWLRWEKPRKARKARAKKLKVTPEMASTPADAALTAETLAQEMSFPATAFAAEPDPLENEVSPTSGWEEEP